MTEDLIITKVSKNKDWYSISTNGGTGFGIKTKYGVEPKEGDTVTLHTINFSTIRGIDLNGKKLFYKTDEELETERKEWLKNNEIRKQAEFEKNKDNMDKQYNALPDFFKKRIDRFRKNNPEFRVDFESYELFCCEQAVVIAKACKTPEAVEKFRKLEWEEQKKMVKKLDEGHSGNTFGASCQMAYWFLKQPDVVEKIHGALSPLVGSKEYGDVPKEK